MTTIARVKGWGDFQHYKDRSPPWIKLHRSLIDNHDYYQLTAEAGKALPLLWIIASENDGFLPEIPRIAFRLHRPQALVESIVSELMDRGFLLAADAEQAATPAQPKRCDWPSRHIPASVRIEVWNRDGGKCVCCGSVEKIEYDHKLPVSKGGESTAENLQLLCRTCNRRKRQRTSLPAGLGMRSPETEGEAEPEKKKPIARQVARSSDRFAEFWALYPVKKGRKDAAAKWKARNLDAIADRILADVRDRMARDRQWKEGFIPHGSTYVNGEGWEDAIDDSAPKVATDKNGRPEIVPNPQGTSPAVKETAKTKLAGAVSFVNQQLDLNMMSQQEATAYLRPYQEAARAAIHPE